MSSDTLLDERETTSERGGDEEQVVRKLIAGGMLRRRRLRRLLLAHLPARASARKTMRTRAAKRRKLVAVRITGSHAS